MTGHMGMANMHTSVGCGKSLHLSYAYLLSASRLVPILHLYRAILVMVLHKNVPCT